MHYFTYKKARKFFEGLGFKVEDIRENKIGMKFRGIKKTLALSVYKLLRPWYFDSCHLLLKKEWIK